MRIRLPFAGAFVFLLVVSAYLGLTSIQILYVNDKALHFVTFFVLTTCFYWILDTSRRRNLNFALIACTGILGVGSEIVQGFIPNDRVFDPYDILANVVGSLAAIGLCSLYHKRMLERKRQAKQYHVVPSDELDGEDVELGEGAGPQESAVADAVAPTLDEEVDNWDENVEDNWDEGDPVDTEESGDGEGPKTPSSGSAVDEVVGSKRSD
ncbi:MAG: hypothetical protein M1827_000211 [Pycnora praestabilis]|nr:MAG: hypothetical protein M1827_000211 [Pycnora praestabilis]